jgi:uncharacterized membrane protein
LNDEEIEKKIIQIISEHTSNLHGITKTELARIFSERWGTSKTTIWTYIQDLIESGQIELRKTKKIQSALFIPK